MFHREASVSESSSDQAVAIEPQSSSVAPPAKPAAGGRLADRRPLSIWQAPLVPVALAATAGVVADRYTHIPLPISLIAATAGLLAWTLSRRSSVRSLLYLWSAIAALGAAYHHAHRELYADDDIGRFAADEPRLVQLRGVLEEEPAIAYRPAYDPLQSIPATDSTRAVLRATQVRHQDNWIPVSGLAKLIVADHLTGLHVGDEVEVVGRLVKARGAANPGEFDYAATLQDQRIGAQVVVRKTPNAVTRLAEGWRHSFFGWLAVLRGWGQRQLAEALPAPQSGLAMALLLGEGSTMTARDWDTYIRTGVIHVLAISGQHLVVLAAFLWWLPRLLGVRRRQAAWLVALFLLTYSLLVGGRPPVMRSAVMVCVACGGLILRRPVLTVNSFALSWLIVGLLNPTDWFTIGCQLSFLSVAVLYWGASRWFRTEPDPLEQLVEENRPPWERLLRRLGRSVIETYLVTLAIWLAIAPLVASRYHLVSPPALLIGPPVSLLAAVALVAGFLLLLAAALCSPLVPVFAGVTHWSLAGCDGLVRLADSLPGGHWYVIGFPDWWLWLFYLGLLAMLALEPLYRRWRWAVPAGLAWLCLGLIVASLRPATGEFRCTFLAVGHGGCIVIETPDGRTLLYDAGALGGPEVTQRQIAPFLWHRGIQRIDEVFLSHADLDHFNGLPSLLDRFAVGRVTCTPSFRDKPIPGVDVAVAALARHRVPVQVVSAGDRLTAGGVEIEVLHPPAVGPEGVENARSLVLLLGHAGHTILLTGDLADAGLAQVLARPPARADVLMAPHHGSKTANTPALAQWAQPVVVVSCQGAPGSSAETMACYRSIGATFLETWLEGAITLRSSTAGLVAETFQTGRSLRIR
jgi:competence protein ComEC